MGECGVCGTEHSEWFLKLENHLTELVCLHFTVALCLQMSVSMPALNKVNTEVNYNELPHF